MQGSRLPKRATLIAETIDGAGRYARQIELCTRHCDIVIERERSCVLEISDCPAPRRRAIARKYA